MIRFVVPVDVGLTHDRTAFVVLEPPQPGGQIRGHQIKRLPKGEPIRAQADAIAATVRKLHDAGHAVDLPVDTTGVGGAVLPEIADRLRGLRCRVLPVIINGANEARTDGTVWYVPKRELVTAAQLTIEQRSLSFAKNCTDRDVLLAELRGFQMTAGDAGRMTYGNDLRQAEHDDLVLATAIGLWWIRRAMQLGPIGLIAPPRRAGAPEISWWGPKGAPTTRTLTPQTGTKP